MLQRKRIPGNKRRLFRFISVVLRYLTYLSTVFAPLFTVHLGYYYHSHTGPVVENKGSVVGGSSGLFREGRGFLGSIPGPLEAGRAFAFGARILPPGAAPAMLLCYFAICYFATLLLCYFAS
jgi:hypothetical protein